MRLIDADELRKQICKGFNQTEPDENPMVDLCECLADFISIIEKQPTAYDVDKVVEELSKKQNNKGFGGTLQEMFYDSGLDDAIEIVKGGGIK